MKVAIDCRGLRARPVGVANFLIAVINHWSEHKKDWTFYLLSNESFNKDAQKKLSTSENIIQIVEPFFLFPSISTLWYFVKLPFIIRRIKPDLFYSPIPSVPPFLNGKIKTLVTVHDMVYKLFPETMSLENRLVNFLLHDKSIKSADKLWTISEYTKGEIEKFYPARKSQKIIVGTAVETNIYHVYNLAVQEKEFLLKKFQIQQPFILTVGTLEPRKNLSFLLSLIPSLVEQNFQVVVVGASGWGSVESNLKNTNAEAAQKLKFLGFVSDTDLVNLYSLASVYISTSLNEGFCLPLLEAMHCGCPVIAAHNSGMVEVVHQAGETVQGWDPREWVNTIEKVVSQRTAYAEKGLTKAGRYAWDDIISRVSQNVSNGN